MLKNIRKVFNYQQPLLSDSQRAYFERKSLVRELQSKLSYPGILFIAGYSGIGKSSLLNIATERDFNDKINNDDIRRSIQVDRLIAITDPRTESGNVLGRIYSSIKRYSNTAEQNHDEKNISSEILVAAFHNTRSILLIDNVQWLDEHHLTQIASFLKTWQDSPKSQNQAKIVLMYAGNPARARLVSDTLAFAKDELTIPPWERQELQQLIESGSKILGLHYTSSAVNQILALSCGLPQITVLLAAITAENAVASTNVTPQSNSVVNADDIQAVMEPVRLNGLIQSIGRGLRGNSVIDNSQPEVQYLLGLVAINHRPIQENAIYKLIDNKIIEKSEINRIILQTIDQQLVQHDGIQISINEMVYGSTAILHLYRQSAYNRSAEKLYRNLMQFYAEVAKMPLETILIESVHLLFDNARLVLEERQQRRLKENDNEANDSSKELDELTVSSEEYLVSIVQRIRIDDPTIVEYELESLKSQINHHRVSIADIKETLARGTLSEDATLRFERKLRDEITALCNKAGMLRRRIQQVVDDEIEIPYLDDCGS